MQVSSQLGELRKKISEENPDSSIIVSSLLLEERDINGGLDWYEKSVELCVRNNNWIKLTVEERSREIERASGTKRSVRDSYEMSDKDVESYLNSQRCTLSEVSQVLASFDRHGIK
ncbi:hypothetical protein SB847_10840 [Bacillus sp. SIMBA_026]|uniref:hypothetical protein n=1 Tax=Bacillus TaxID=1386 RepID=UPI001E36542E|nr:hypothetical protein [Bacillus velezensis]